MNEPGVKWAMSCRGMSRSMDRATIDSSCLSASPMRLYLADGNVRNGRVSVSIVRDLERIVETWAAISSIEASEVNVLTSGGRK